MTPNPFVRRVTTAGYGTLSTDTFTFTAGGTIQSGDAESAMASVSANNGVRYFEVTIVNPTVNASQGYGLGVYETPTKNNVTGTLSGTGNTAGRHMGFELHTFNDYYNGASKDGPSWGQTWLTAGDIVGCYLDFGAGTMHMRKNAGALVLAPLFTPVTSKWYAPAVQMFTAQANAVTFNLGTSPFSFQPTGITGLIPFNQGL